MLVLFQELDLQKKKALQIECEKGSKNDLLEYLRSLDSEMVRNVLYFLLISYSQSADENRIYRWLSYLNYLHQKLKRS